MKIYPILLAAFLLISLPSCAEHPSFSAEQAGLQAVRLGALSLHSSEAFVAFEEQHGSDADRIFQQRFSAVEADMNREAMAVYQETLSKKEIEYIGRMYGTKQGRDILEKYKVLYPKLALIGERYSLQILSAPNRP